jgi:hypothetical protein
MDPVDRFQALIRHPDYRNDPRLEDVLTFELTGFEFKKAFELGIDVRYLGRYFPHDELCKPEWWQRLCAYVDFLECWGLCHGVDYKNPATVSVVLAAFRTGDDSIFTDDIRSYDTERGYIAMPTSSNITLSFSVDLLRPTKELVALFCKRIDTEKKRLETPTKRTKPRGIDVWQVWDGMQAPGMNLHRLAKTRHPGEESHAYSAPVKATYAQMARAHDHAVAMIKAVPRGGKFTLESRNIREALTDLAAGIDAHFTTRVPCPPQQGTSVEFAKALAGACKKMLAD